MSGLPRKDGGALYLHRYDPGSLPSRRQRTCIGRSNRIQDEGHLLGELTQHYVALPQSSDPPDGATRTSTLSVIGRLGNKHRGLSIGEALTRAEYVAIGHCQISGGPAASSRVPSRGEKAGEMPSTTNPTPSPPSLTLVQQRKSLDVANPAAAALLREKRKGQGHTVWPENLFIRPRGECVTIPQDEERSYDGVPTKAAGNIEGIPFFGLVTAADERSFREALHPPPDPTTTTLAAFTRLPQQSCGGGELEYNNPMCDTFCRNELVARHNIHESRKAAKCQQDLRSGVKEVRLPQQATTPVYMGCAPDSALGGIGMEEPDTDRATSVKPTQADASAILVVDDQSVAPPPSVGPANEQKPRDVLECPNGTSTDTCAGTPAPCPATPPHIPSDVGARNPTAAAAVGMRRWNKARPVLCPSVYDASFGRPSSREVENAEWIATHRPYPRPYEVPPCLGRCGRSDYHATFGVTQAAPESSQYISDAERFVTTKQVQLFTPNDWQVRVMQGKP